MATIKTAIQIYDQMSRPLQAMSRGVNTLINAMETAQGTFDHGFDSSVLQQVREDIAEATVGFDQMEQQIRQADTAQNRFNDRVQEGSDRAGVASADQEYCCGRWRFGGNKENPWPI